MAQIQQERVLGGRYRLIARVASGGMGTVWRARDVVLDRAVAVKTLSEALGQDARFVERFRREARAAAGLSHPNVAGVYDYGEDGATPFIVMELLDGETLARRLERDGRLPPAEAAWIAVHVAEALQAAHDAGVIHRDVKPGNVMLTQGGGLKVMDFGIAATSWAVPLTATGTTMGTAAYLSPEQASGERATPSSDVYALGCVLYEMLTGQAPFPGETPVAVAAAHIGSRALPVRRLVPEVPGPLAEACERALEKDPASRPRSAGSFAALLAPTIGVAEPIPTGRNRGPGSGSKSTQVLPAAAPTSPLPAVSPTSPLPPTSTGAPRARRVRSVLWALIVVLLAGAMAVTLVLAFAGGKGTKSPSQRSPSAGSSPPAATTAKVPQVVGLPVDEAEAKVVDAGLVPNTKEVRGDRGVVLGAMPEEGTTLEPGDSVTLFVGDGHEGKHKGKDGGNGGEGH